MTRENRAKRKLQAGGAVLAITINFANATLAEYLGNLGYDIIVLDAEHGPLEDSTVEDFARACDLSGAAAMIRLPLSGPLMQRYLALGAYGFQVPQVRSGAEAREIVEAVKFPPAGKRGLGNFRAGNFGSVPGGWPSYIQAANAGTLIMVQVEDTASIASLPEIVAIPDVDVVNVGVVDLSAELGVPGQPKHQRVLDVVEPAEKRIRQAGKVLGVGVGSAADIKAAHANGARYFITSVAHVLRIGSDELLGAMKELD